MIKNYTYPRSRTSVYSLHNIYPYQQVYPPQTKTYPPTVPQQSGPSVYPPQQQQKTYPHQPVYPRVQQPQQSSAFGMSQSTSSSASLNQQNMIISRSSSPIGGSPKLSMKNNNNNSNNDDPHNKLVCVNPNLVCSDPFSDYLNGSSSSSSQDLKCDVEPMIPISDYSDSQKMMIVDKTVSSSSSPIFSRHQEDKVLNSPSGALDCSVGGSLNEPIYEDDIEAIADSDDSTNSPTPPKTRKRKFKERVESDELSTSTDEELLDRLPASKSPVMEALSYCAIKKLGIEIYECKDESEISTASVVFKVIDFDMYYKYSSAICSKQNPTEDIQSRIKSLRRWFTNFPAKRERSDSQEFLLQVKPELAKKVHDMVGKHGCIESIKKRRKC